jgi:hypothetical protein
LAFGAPTGNASLTLDGVMAAGAPFNNTAFIMQSFNFGNLEIYNESNTLLLSADLNKSGIQGAVGPNKQGLFLGFGEITGGLLAQREYRLDPDSLQLRIKFPKILGNGFTVSAPPNSQLQDFTTWTSSVEIMALVVPEPSVGLLLVTLALSLLPARRRRRT